MKGLTATQVQLDLPCPETDSRTRWMLPGGCNWSVSSFSKYRKIFFKFLKILSSSPDITLNDIIAKTAQTKLTTITASDMRSLRCIPKTCWSTFKSKVQALKSFSKCLKGVQKPKDYWIRLWNLLFLAMLKYNACFALTYCDFAVPATGCRWTLVNTKLISELLTQLKPGS